MRKNLNSSFVVVSFLLALAGCDSGVPTKKLELIEPNSAGAKLLVKYCSDCHAPESPKAHVASEWAGVLYRMQERRRMKAYSMMNEDELAVLTEYLQKHAKEEE